MKKADAAKTKLFAEKYCHGDDARNTIVADFDVNIESYEELLPGQTITSYASGNREIRTEFIMFNVIDAERGIIYHPVFSGSVGRRLAKKANLKLPSKMSIFTAEGGGDGGDNEGGNDGATRNIENRKMLQLIRFARSMMLLNVDEPKPMYDPFRSIYVKLEKHPGFAVFESNIKSINTAIQSYLKKDINRDYQNFENLQQYIQYLQDNYPQKRLRDHDFDILRNKFQMEYPNEEIYF